MENTNSIQGKKMYVKEEFHCIALWYAFSVIVIQSRFVVNGSELFSVVVDGTRCLKSLLNSNSLPSFRLF